MSELQHHGILGQKWGVRRYQNPDGSLTPAGKKRYGYSLAEAKDAKELAEGLQKRIKDSNRGIFKSGDGGTMAGLKANSEIQKIAKKNE